MSMKIDDPQLVSTLIAKSKEEERFKHVANHIVKVTQQGYTHTLGSLQEFKAHKFDGYDHMPVVGK